MAIYKTIPIVDQTIWGSNRLNQWRHQNSQDGGTSWEISFHPYGSNRVVNRDKTLKELLEDDPEAMIGALDPKKVLRLAYLDTKDWLSVQLHPTHAYSKKQAIGDDGKYEAWYIVEAPQEGCIIAGTVIETVEALEKSIKNHTVLDHLIKIPVHKDDFIYIPAGTLHALGKDILAFEISTNSNTTYRVYDYQRIDAQGNQRDLHIDQVIDCVDLSLKPQTIKVNYQPNRLQVLTENEHFKVIAIDVENSFVINTHHQALYITCIEKEMMINRTLVSTYDSVFVTSDEALVELVGDGRVLISQSTL